jgi:hypothetical protein
MATVRHVERRIRAVEGFEVHLRYAEPGRHVGKDVRGDRENVHAYPYSVGARNEWTVAAWLEKRLEYTYPGFTAVVLDGRGDPVHGRTTLATVRASYDG